MCGKLLRTQPVFRQHVHELQQLILSIEPTLGIFKFLFFVMVILDVVREMSGDPNSTNPYTKTSVSQPVLFVVEVALVKLLRSWGIEPSAVVGHSIGLKGTRYYFVKHIFKNGFYL
jgi:myxalamid-type polyketide synthase MxaB